MSASESHSITDDAGPASTDPTVVDAGGPGEDAGRYAALGAVPGRYELLEEIAQGGMGVVYRATDVALGREVAVKVLRDRFAPGSSAAHRFVDEARIAGQLQHPGIPAVHDVGAGSDGRPFLAMRLIKGRTLDGLLQGRADPGVDRGRFVAVFEQICQAVAYAHAHQVIHRDLKPANVMVGAFGEVQVMDWGLAKVLGAGRRGAGAEGVAAATEIRSLRMPEDGATEAGSVLGTPAYMPPEQAAGAVGLVDERSDVFGLGAILAVILTGVPPFAADSSESARVLAALGRVGDCYGRLDECGAEPDLVALCKRCLAPERADRPADAGEVARAVADLRAQADERARQAELDRARVEAEAREQRKRRRAQAALVVALAAVGALVALVMWLEDRRAAERARLRASATERFAAWLDDATSAFRQDRALQAGAALDGAGGLLEIAEEPGVRRRFDELQADRATVAELDRIWARAGAIMDERAPGGERRAGGVLRFDEQAARAGYPRALAARGIDVVGAPEAAAGRISGSAIRDRLVAALDDWLSVAAPGDRGRIRDVLARVDPDPDRSDVRAALADRPRLASLFAGPVAESALRVAVRAATEPEVPDERALAVLRAAAIRHADDFRVLYAAGVRSLRVSPAAAVGYFRATAALRPDNLAAVGNLGLALHRSGGHVEAAPFYLRAIEIDPGFVSAYLNLADTIKMGADPAPAVAYFEREVRRDPRRAMAYFGLGMALRDQEPRLAEAEAALRKAIELDGSFAMAHNYLGYVLNSRRAPPDEIIACYRRAIERDPSFAFPHYNLALTLRDDKRDIPGAIAEFREALRLSPEHTFSHRELGRTLAARGDLSGAAGHLRRVIEINPGFATAYTALGEVLARSGDAAGAADVLRTCVRRFPSWHEGYNALVPALSRAGANAEGARVYLEATLRADATWPGNVRRQLRYNAACCAALAGTGAGTDAPTAADRSIFRQRALEWLRAEWQAFEKDAGDHSTTAAVHRYMTHWLADGDLAGVREADALARLPREEQGAWKQLWDDVRRLRAATGPAQQNPKDGGRS